MCHTFYKFVSGRSINKDTWKIKITFWLCLGFYRGILRKLYTSNYVRMRYSRRVVAMGQTLKATLLWERSSSWAVYRLLLRRDFCGNFMLCTFRAWARRMGGIRLRSIEKLRALYVENHLLFPTVSRQQLEEFVWNIESSPLFHACVTHRVPVLVRRSLPFLPQ